MHMARFTRFLGRSFLLSAVGLGLGPGCVINSDGGDGGDSAADDGGSGGDDGGSAGDGGSGGDDGNADGAADSSGGAGDDGSAGGAPADGIWGYSETGVPANTCAFLDDVSNGWGSYEVTTDGAGAFTIIPGDDTDPFPCTHDGSTFECPERLVDEVTAGTTVLEVQVRVEGSLSSSTSMSGSQLGTVTCEGADCATAEALLMTTLPCSFEVEFTGTHV
jgi:hypothetical protein